MSRSSEENEQSSESEEETSSRHDRFKSERFQESSSVKTTPKWREANTSSRFYNEDKYRSRSNRDRSPVRYHRYKESSRPSSSSQGRTESKSYHSNNHDRKEKRHHSKSSKHENLYQESEKYTSEPKNKEKVIKTNLSSILKDFDRKVESKRSDTDSKTVIGPILPPNLKDKLEPKNCDSEFVSTNCPAGPVLPPHLRQDVEKPSSIDSSDNSSNNGYEPVCRFTSKGIESIPKNGSSGSKDEHEPLFLEGPALPPNLCKVGNEGDKEIKICGHESPSLFSNELNEQQNKEDGRDFKESKQESFGPALPPKLGVSTYGPALPPKLETDSYGPALPPQLHNKSICGPALPKEGIPENIGQESDEDDDMVGPLPEGKMTLTQYQLSLRAMDIKRKIEEERHGASSVEKKREEWMLELPPEKAANLGLGPRSFRMRAAPDMSNRSSWTDTPEDKLRKEQQAAAGETEPVNSEEMMKAAFIQERNEAMDKISKHSKEEDRPKSLLEMHQKKLKKKKKKQDKEEKEGKKKERRPFDRNIDLQANRFDDAQKKAIFKKARLLDTRFSTGESKYL